jgi:hypothetical protein
MDITRLEDKIDKLHNMVCEYMVKQEARLSKIETIQRAFVRGIILLSAGGIVGIVGFLL